jgi:hypothetical protein
MQRLTPALPLALTRTAKVSHIRWNECCDPYDSREDVRGLSSSELDLVTFFIKRPRDAQKIDAVDSQVVIAAVLVVVLKSTRCGSSKIP